MKTATEAAKPCIVVRNDVFGAWVEYLPRRCDRPGTGFTSLHAARRFARDESISTGWNVIDETRP